MYAVYRVGQCIVGLSQNEQGAMSKASELIKTDLPNLETLRKNHVSGVKGDLAIGPIDEVTDKV